MRNSSSNFTRESGIAPRASPLAASQSSLAALAFTPSICVRQNGIPPRTSPPSNLAIFTTPRPISWHTSFLRPHRLVSFARCPNIRSLEVSLNGWNDYLDLHRLFIEYCALPQVRFEQTRITPRTVTIKRYSSLR